MSIKSTRYVSRTQAMAALLAVIPQLPDKVLGDMLDLVADTREYADGYLVEPLSISYFDNFMVHRDEDKPDW